MHNSRRNRAPAAPQRVRQHLTAPPLAWKKSDAAPRYLIVTTAQQTPDIGRVQIKVWC